MAQGVTDKKLLVTRMQIQQVACPWCKEPPGRRCRTPRGTATLIPHRQRRSAAADAGLYKP